MEGKTHYERIIGGTQEEKEIASRELQAAFEERSKKLTEYEVEKTPEDLEIIKKTESIVDKMVLQYGGVTKALPPEHIYVLKPGGVLAMTEGRLAGGIYKPLGLEIGVEKGKSKLLFASTIAHELFHLKSYKSARVGKSGEDIRLYRSGVSMIDRKDQNEESGEEKEYFAMLEEAIVAECTKKFLDEIGEDREFSEEVQAVKKFRNWVVAYYHRRGIPEEKTKEFERELKYIADPQDKVEQVFAFSDDEEKRQAYAAGMFGVLYERGGVETVERYGERKKLYQLLDKLVINSDGKFKSRDEVFDEFARANFSGNYLPLARTIEGILGKGAFRKLAEEFSKEPKKEKHKTSETANP
ncbi:MAG: hypothetical protein HYT65_03560 [Candidatus Yanofskybacteria bacterium]|nr:hypothetical protein [Candidatus Yanofskybacteria bacterium]